MSGRGSLALALERASAMGIVQVGGATLHGRLVYRYDVPVAPWFVALFAEMAQVYAASAAKPATIELHGVSPAFEQLVAGYYAANGLTAAIARAGEPAGVEKPALRLRAERVTVMLSGGKDSVHNLIRAVAMFGRANVQAVYVDKINRSECYYERAAAGAIAKRLRVRYRCVEGLNSVAVNRTGHNIGLREQLVTTLALPYIVDFGSAIVTFGVTLAAVSAPLWTDSNEAWSVYLGALRERYGIALSFREHLDFPDVDELQIIRDLITDYPAVFSEVRSCYTQRNWREQMHDRLAATVPTIAIYNGCGNCIKCLRINGALLLYDRRLARADPADVARLREHVLRVYAEKQLGADRYLSEIVRQLEAA